jgi:hypothetical protein
MNSRTSYYGIWIFQDNGYYFLQSDRGDEKAFDRKPTQKDIDKFANECRK